MRELKLEIPRVAAALAVALLVALPQAAEAKKLQVVAERAAVHLDADAASPVIETLDRGAVMTLASAVKSRTSWFYVFFTSSRTGRTRSGYIADAAVRKLYPDLKVVQISSEDEVAAPEDLDFSDAYRPLMEWGAAREDVLAAEGRPQGRETVEGVEIVTYKRKVLGRRCRLEYVFEDERLAATRISLLENFADKNRYIADYLKLKDFAVSKVGAPVADTVLWQDSALRGEEDLWGTALGNGQLEFQARWDLAGTDIVMKLVGGNSRVALGAEFSGPDIKTASF